MKLRKILLLALLSVITLSVCGCAYIGGSNDDSGTTTEYKPLTVKVTIIEGQTLVQIFKTLEEKGVCSFDSLMAAAQSFDYSDYPLVAAAPTDKNRAFRLEGYLFPDTYEFYTDSSPEKVIRKFLSNTESRISQEYRDRAGELGYSVDEIITVASIIQKEGSKSSEVGKIAGVIYNRLKIEQKLQMDSTIDYIEKYVKSYITGDADRYSAAYNTYKCASLPDGPICNPGLETIKAALYPEDVPYYYFCHDTEAKYYYAATYEEHLKNVDAAGIS